MLPKIIGYFWFITTWAYENILLTKATAGTWEHGVTVTSDVDEKFKWLDHLLN